MSTCLKINPVVWDDAERTGLRNVTVSFNGNNIMAVLSHFQSGSWESSVVPMGFSYDSTEVLAFIEFFKVLPELMKFLETSSVLTSDDVQLYIDSLDF